MEGLRRWFLTFLLLMAPVCLAGDNSIKNFFGFFTKTTTPAPGEGSSNTRSCNCVCGIRNDGSRIVGGNEASVNEFPWMVRLLYINKFYCGGTLINDRYVLTAAHCVKGFMWFLIKVTFGEHDQCNKTVLPETRYVLRATIGDFSYFNFHNDIAVLKLNDRVPISDFVRPICLPTNRVEQYTSKMATVAGWGTTSEGGSVSCQLLEVDLPIMSNDDCRKTNYSTTMITDQMMCAGYTDGGHDSCQGDSGGSMISRREDNKYEIIGSNYQASVVQFVGWSEGPTVGGATVSSCRPRRVGYSMLNDKEYLYMAGDLVNLITDDKGCVGTGGKESTICSTDAGGPVQYPGQDGYFELVDVLPDSNICTSTGTSVTIFTRLNVHFSWLFQNTRDSCYCRKS